MDGFENVLTTWFAERDLTCLVTDKSHVEHSGQLESTPRQWHMTASLDDAAAPPHLYVFGESPALWRRAYMLAKLAARFATVAVRQFWNDATYEIAFRIVTLPMPKAQQKGVKTSDTSNA